MEFSCHIWAFNDMRLQEALGTIARLGFRYVDIGSGPHLNPAYAVDVAERKAMFQELRDDLALFNLKVADMYLFFPRISLDDVQKRQADILLFKAMLPFATALNASGVTVTPGLLHPDNDDTAWSHMVESLQEMVNTAQEADLALSFEPHLDSMVYTIERIHKLLEAVDGLQLTLDWAHLVCQGIAHKQIVTLLPHARHIQIRQAAKGKLQTAFDAGTIDIGQVVAALKKVNHSGYVSVEYMQTPGWHGMEAVNSVVECARMRDALRDARDQ